MIDVVAAEMRVAVGRQHLEHAVLDAQNRDVEGAAAEVVDGDDAGVALVEAVGERRRRRLVDDAQHFESGDAAGVARRRALRVVEVGRHGDDRAIDFGIDLALGGEELLGAMLQLAQDERGNLRRRELALAEADADDAAGFAGDAERQQLRLVAHVVDALAHEALDGVDGARRLGQEPPLRLAADEDRAVGADRHDRRHERVAALVADHDRRAVLHVRDEAVGGAEIDADDFAHSTTVFAGLAGFRAGSASSVSESGAVSSRSIVRQQVVDVVALEHPLAQRAQHRPRARSSAAAVDERVPLRRQRLQLLFVLLALVLRSAARRAAAAARHSSAGAPLVAQVADLVELLVQREHFLEQRRRHLLRRPVLRCGRPASARLRARAGTRSARSAASACDTRRSGTTSARGWRAARPAARCRSSPDETGGSARGSAARGPR